MRASIGKFLAVLLLFAVLGPNPHAGTVTYIYTDPQGSVLAEADANGVMTTAFDYRPYGGQALGAFKDGPGYTGHVGDSDSGLVYMQQRYYEPAAGRFLSVDPVPPRASNLFNFNRYVYGNNNPLLNVDPDGRESACINQKSRCSGNNPAAKAAAKSIVHFTFGVLSAVANRWNETMHAGTPEGEPIEPTNGAQVAGQVIGTIAIEAGSAIITDGTSGEASASRLASAAKKVDFFEGSYYSPKVLAQMKQGDFHAFPESVKAFQDSGQVTPLVGGDGQTRELLTIPGGYRGREGSFEFIKSPSGEINHRLFQPNAPMEK